MSGQGFRNLAPRLNRAVMTKIQSSAVFVPRLAAALFGATASAAPAPGEPGVHDVDPGNPPACTPRDDGIEATGIDRKSSAADTIIAVVCHQPVINVWKH